MGVMEEQPVTTVPRPMPAYGLHQLVVVPLVHQHEIRLVELTI
jgi:hypothetical protein